MSARSLISKRVALPSVISADCNASSKSTRAVRFFSRSWIRLTPAATAAETSSRMREKSSVDGVVAAVVSPLVIRYVIGLRRSSGICPRSFRRTGLSLQRPNCLLEVENLPESDSQIQRANAGHSASPPTRRNDGLQTIEAGLAGCVEQKVVVAP